MYCTDAHMGSGFTHAAQLPLGESDRQNTCHRLRSNLSVYRYPEVSAEGLSASMKEPGPLEVESAAGPAVTPVEMNGRTVNAVLLQPMTAADATEAATHQIVAPRCAMKDTSHMLSAP